MRNEALLQRLTQAQGIAGYEKEVRELIEAEVRPYADEVMVDPLGSLIVLKKGRPGPHSKKIMFAAHMDEIGFMVKKIEADGRLRVCNMGWNWAAAAYNGRVRFRNGVVGVVGCMGAIEDAHNDVGKLYIDIGAKSKEDAEKYVQVGSVCGYYGEYLPLKNGLVTAKSFDDRTGCFQMIEALRENDGTYPNDIYYVFTVQEELGCRGSKPTAARISPDIGIAMDVTPAHDYPCDLEGSNTVGAGIAIKYADPSVVSDEDVVAAMEECCRSEGIPFQPEVIDKGGTDASSMNLSGFGVRTGGIAVVTRYPHAPCSVVSTDDVEAGIKLCTAISKYEFTTF
ncbi:MAG TPA: M20/M25/M40 family metallo-hydrolase [Candidatus Scatomorpha gallistercoris]|nr:M20/M25/M40 family metallo-hydrolase [Candidatus Scatomorpha gallistercoris]